MQPEGVNCEDILIVEDNEVNAFILRTMLRRQGYEPRVARDGAEGIALTVAHGPRLVFMDLHMPGLDGFAAASLIRSRMNATAPILVAVTAAAGADVESACLDAGFTCVLAKPIDIDVVAETVRRYLV